MELKSVMRPIIGKGLMSLLLVIGCLSCSTIFTDQSDCPRGVSLSFIYDYNMEFSNSFHKKVHCLSVYVFDENGNYVGTYEEESEILKDESYRMALDLNEGSYTLIAYGGLACDESSFTTTSFGTGGGSRINDMQVKLNCDDSVSDESLHSLFYGMLELTIGEDEFVEDTVYLKKNTNNIRIVLQQTDGRKMSSDDFTFAITDDNALMDVQNSVIPSGTVTYRPYASGQAVVGLEEEGETEISVVYSELSTARLTLGTSPKLIVKNAGTGEDIINIPLNNYLLLLRSALYEDMPAQEFLDRQSEWSMVFLLDSGLRWVNTRIIVNDWVVRLNNAEL